MRSLEPDVDGVDDAASARRLAAHVHHLAGTIGERNLFVPDALEAARRYIEEEWEHQGYQVTSPRFFVQGHACANVEIERPGEVAGARILLIGAHYDSVAGSPGANDNGTGVAALLEISRGFAVLSPAVTVRFVAFVNEEPPFFTSDAQGSEVYARAARARGDDICLMVSLETIGYYSDAPGSQRYPPLFGLLYPNRGNFLAFVSDLHSAALMGKAAAAFGAASDFPVETVATFRFIPGVSWSDHGPFWRCGYRACMVTDTAFYRDPCYHTAADRPERLSFPALARVTKGLFHAFATLSSELAAPRGRW